MNPCSRSFTERAFDNVKTDFEYSFVHHLTALDELDSKKEDLLSRKATFLMKYEGKQHPVCILLEKCTEAFIVLFGEDVGDVLDEILNKIFLKIIKQHQDRISGKRTKQKNGGLNPINGNASFRWSFCPQSAWGSIESTTILTTHPSLHPGILRILVM